MLFSMVRKTAMIVKRLGTNLTFVRSSICVDDLMIFQLFIGFTVSLTYTTDWRIVVDKHMVIQSAVTSESLFTLGTLS